MASRTPRTTARDAVDVQLGAVLAGEARGASNQRNTPRSSDSPVSGRAKRVKTASRCFGARGRAAGGGGGGARRARRGRRRGSPPRRRARARRTARRWCRQSRDAPSARRPRGGDAKAKPAAEEGRGAPRQGRRRRAAQSGHRRECAAPPGTSPTARADACVGGPRSFGRRLGHLSVRPGTRRPSTQAGCNLRGKHPRVSNAPPPAPRPRASRSRAHPAARTRLALVLAPPSARAIVRRVRLTVDSARAAASSRAPPPRLAPRLGRTSRLIVSAKTSAPSRSPTSPPSRWGSPRESARAARSTSGRMRTSPRSRRTPPRAARSTSSPTAPFFVDNDGGLAAGGGWR